MMSVTMLPVTSEKQTLDLTLCVIRHLAAVDDKILRDHTVGVPLTGLDLRTQQSCEE
jgi:hypothetical protein